MPGQNQFRLLGQRRFAPFFVTQFLGALNDNIFRNGLVILVTFQGVLVAGRGVLVGGGVEVTVASSGVNVAVGITCTATACPSSWTGGGSVGLSAPVS